MSSSLSASSARSWATRLSATSSSSGPFRNRMRDSNNVSKARRGPPSSFSISSATDRSFSSVLWVVTAVRPLRAAGRAAREGGLTVRGSRSTLTRPSHPGVRPRGSAPRGVGPPGPGQLRPTGVGSHVSDSEDDAKRGRRSSGSRTLSRGLALLNALGEHNDGATVSGLAETTGLDRAVLYRLLDTLVGEGFVTRDQETRKYRLGLSMLELGVRAAQGLEHGQPQPVLAGLLI